MHSEALWVFDCDGVLVDTNEQKVNAMLASLASEGASIDFLEWAEADFRANFGRSRDLHMKSFAHMANHLGFKFGQQAQAQVLSNYSKCVQNIYATCDFIPETVQFMGVTLDVTDRYLVSASSQDELRAILPNRTSLFCAAQIFGGPRAKAKNLQCLGKKSNASSHIYVGDSVSDAMAAQSAGFIFLGVTKYSAAPDSLRDFCKVNGLPCYEHCGEISKKLCWA